jgi:predicted nucleotidyltransferase
MKMEKEKVFKLIEEVLSRDSRLVFAYTYGSFVSEEAYRDIDIGIYVKNPEENPFVISSDIKTQLSLLAKKEGLTFTADDFDIRIINDAPFTFMKRVFTEGILLVDNDSDLRTDIIENVSLKYRECTGLLAEASLG